MIKKKFIEGFIFGLGIFFALSLIGTVFAVGFHYANEILPGTFSGNYIFNGDVNITSGNDICIEGGKCLNGTLASEIDPTVLASVKDGVNWTEVIDKPAGFADGVDDVGLGDITAVTAGTGLTGGGTTGAVTLNVDTAYMQRRVSSTCAAGSSIRAISSTGTVTCETDDTGSGIAKACNWVGWKESTKVTAASGVVCNSGNDLCSWDVSTSIYCDGTYVTDVKMISYPTSVRNSCFAAGTSVLMLDGSYKTIEDVIIGDKIASLDGYNTVIDYDRPMLTYEKDQRLMSINGGDFFITDNHPILTTKGWVAYLPENAESEAYDILHNNIVKLKIGDEIILSNGKTMIVKTIEIKEKEKGEQPSKLYNFVLDGDNTYYANDMLVIGFVPDKAGLFPIEKEH